MSHEAMEILLVEDNEADAELLQETLVEAHLGHFRLAHAERLDAALQHLTRRGADAILLDLMLPDASGLDTVKQMHAQAPDIPIVVLTGLGDTESAVRAVREGAQDYLVKGHIDGHLLGRAIRYAMERQQTDNEIRRLNQELAQKVNQLAAANKDLAAFDYSISHDLRGPLVVVIGFARLLLENYADKLDAEGQRMLNLIRSYALRMDQLLTDLLAFSGLGQRQAETTIIDMNELVHSVWKELQDHTPERKGQIRIDVHSPAVGDRAMIRQVWVNLLSNALKFTRRREAPAIEVGDRIKEDEIVYYVKDNGEGFDMRYADKLFGVFQRFHKQEDFPGTGVGLAIVERIIHRHGGRVWAEGQINEGATFYFTIPTNGKGL